MRSRATILASVITALVVAALALPLLASLLDGTPAEETAPASVPRLATPSPPPGTSPQSTRSPQSNDRAIKLDLHDPAERSETDRRLQAGGYVVSADASTVLTDRPPSTPDAETTVRAAYALIVHPRSGLVDLALDDARMLLEERTTPSGAPLLVAEAASAWLPREHPGDGHPLEASSTDRVVEEVAGNRDAIGLVPVGALDPRVRALTVGGHDPYRDSADANPLADRRWATGPLAGEAFDVLDWDTRDLPDPVGLLATGELIPARCTQERATTAGGFDAIFDDTRDLLDRADLAVSHWEPAVIDAEPTPCVPTFNLSTVPAAADAAAYAGIDVAFAVGNHVGDCWAGCPYTEAVLQTVDHLRAAGLLTVGAGEDLAAAREPVTVTTSEGITVAVLGYDDIARLHYGATSELPGTAPLDLATFADDVRAAAARADHVVVGISWGVEYVSAPTSRQREAARIAVEAGASLVVGNHPHWVQATEWIDGAFVAYGLGNFVFDQDWSVETTQGAILEVGLARDRILGVRLRPTAIREQHRVELLDPAAPEGATILNRIWDATDALAR